MDNMVFSTKPQEPEQHQQQHQQSTPSSYVPFGSFHSNRAAAKPIDLAALKTFAMARVRAASAPTWPGQEI
jgi:hypothetical protein